MARCMAVYGVVRVITSFVSGQVVKVISISKVVGFAAIFENVIFVVLLVWQPVRDDVNVWVYYVISGAFGLGRFIKVAKITNFYIKFSVV